MHSCSFINGFKCLVIFQLENINTKLWKPPRLESGPIHCFISVPGIVLTSSESSICICKSICYLGKIFIHQGQRSCTVWEGQVDSFFYVQGDAYQWCVNRRWQVMSRCYVMFAVSKVVPSMVLLVFLFSLHRWSGVSRLIVIWSLCQNHRSKLSAA